MEKAKGVKRISHTLLNMVKLDSLEGKVIFSELKNKERSGLNRTFIMEGMKEPFWIKGEHSGIVVGKKIKVYYDIHPQRTEAYELFNSLRVESRYCSQNYEFIDKE